MYTYPSMYEVPSTGLRCQRSHKSVVLVILHVQCHHVMPSVIALQVLTETVNSLDLSKRPFVVKTEDREMEADTVIIATGAVAKRMTFKGSGEGKGGFWNKGISACAVRVLWSARARGGGRICSRERAGSRSPAHVNYSRAAQSALPSTCAS